MPIFIPQSGSPTRALPLPTVFEASIVGIIVREPITHSPCERIKNCEILDVFIPVVDWDAAMVRRSHCD